MLAVYVAITTLALAPLALLGCCLTGISNRLHSRSFSYLAGNGEENGTFCPKIFHLNACMLPGDLPYYFGKMPPAKERFARLVQLIEQENPDIVFLCEFNQTLTPKLFAALKKRYAHFLVNIGSNAIGMDASLCVLTRLPIVRAEFISSQLGMEKKQQLYLRGYFIVETERCLYLYTHLHPKTSCRAKQIREQQVAEMQAIVEKIENKPWIILGDINIPRGTLAQQEMKQKGFVDNIEKEHGMIPTCRREIEEKESAELSLDYFITAQNSSLRLATTVIDTYSTSLPLSDHKAILAQLET